MKNKLFSFLTAQQGCEMIKSKGGNQNFFVLLKLNSRADVLEHHFSVFDEIETNSIAFKSQYHYTATLPEGKVRVYFDESDNVCGANADFACGTETSDAFKVLALAYVQEHIVPIKQSMAEVLRVDEAYLSDGLVQLTELSVQFPDTLSEWQDLSNELVSYFEDKLNYQNDDIISKLEFISNFSSAVEMPPSPIRALSTSSIDEANSPVRERSVEVFEEALIEEESQDKRLSREFIELIALLNTYESRDIDLLIRDYHLIKEVSLMLDKSQCTMIDSACIEQCYQKIGQLASSKLDKAIKDKNLELISHFASQVDLKEIGYNPKSIGHLLINKDTKCNMMILGVLTKAKVFNISQYRLEYKGNRHSLIQYAYLKKNKELLLFILRNGGSLLDKFTDDLPIFYEIFYSQSNPCREILVLSEISQQLTKEFYREVCSILESKGIDDKILQDFAKTPAIGSVGNMQRLRVQEYTQKIQENFGCKYDRKALLADERIVHLYKEVVEVEKTSLKGLTKEQYAQYMQISVKGLQSIAKTKISESMLKLCTGYAFHHIVANGMIEITKTMVECLKMNLYSRSKGMFVFQSHSKSQTRAVSDFNNAIASYTQGINDFVSKKTMLQSLTSLESTSTELEGLDPEMLKPAPKELLEHKAVSFSGIPQETADIINAGPSTISIDIKKYIREDNVVASKRICEDLERTHGHLSAVPGFFDDVQRNLSELLAFAKKELAKGKLVNTKIKIKLGEAKTVGA